MSDEVKIGVIAGAVVSFVLGSIIWAVQLTHSASYAVDKAAIENGYSKASIPGFSCPQWQKPNSGPTAGCKCNPCNCENCKCK